MALDGDGRLVVNLHGDLESDVHGTPTIISAPAAWQVRRGRRVSVEARWTALDDGRFGFDAGPYERSTPLVIDPTIHAGTYLGAAKADSGLGIETDVTGARFLCGSTLSSTFPAQPTSGSGAVAYPTYREATGSPNFETRTDGFVAKLSSDTSSITWCTYLGGTGDDAANDVALDPNGDLLLCGSTSATNFPTTSSSLATSGAGFLARLRADGTSLLKSTYVARAARRVAVDSSGNPFVLSEGSPARIAKFTSSFSAISWTHNHTPPSGSLTGAGIFVDVAGDAWGCGTTTNNSSTQTTSGAYDESYNGGTNDALVWRVNSASGTLNFSSFIGGSGDDRAEDVVCDATGRIYVCGTTTSGNFPSTGGFQTSNRGGTDGFLACLAFDGLSLVWSTYFGGASTDSQHALAIHVNSELYLAGDTQSTTNFQLSNAIRSSHGGGTTDGFVARVSSGGTLRWSTYVGGNGNDTVADVAIGPTGRPAIAGQTASTDFPVVTPVQSSQQGTGDAFAWVVEESSVPFGDVSLYALSPADEATEGVYFGVALPLSGGRSPVVWALESGSLPAGLAVQSSGTLAGAPAAGTIGSHRFKCRATDADGACVTREYTVTVLGPPRIVTTSLPPSTVGESMVAPLAAIGGRSPLTWYVFDASSLGGTGRLPSGTQVLSGGAVAGTPTEAGDFVFGVEVRDVNSAAARGTVSLRMNDRPAIANVTLDDCTEGRAYARTFTATKGTPPYTWSLASGQLPLTGSIVAATGAMAGPLGAPADYAFVVQVTDSDGAQEARAFAMHVNPRPAVMTAALPGAPLGLRRDRRPHVGPDGSGLAANRAVVQGRRGAERDVDPRARLQVRSRRDRRVRRHGDEIRGSGRGAVLLPRELEEERRPGHVRRRRGHRAGNALHRGARRHPPRRDDPARRAGASSARSCVSSTWTRAWISTCPSGRGRAARRRRSRTSSWT